MTKRRIPLTLRQAQRRKARGRRRAVAKARAAAEVRQALAHPSDMDRLDFEILGCLHSRTRDSLLT